jgi:hypothetical protein
LFPSPPLLRSPALLPRRRGVEALPGDSSTASDLLRLCHSGEGVGNLIPPPRREGRRSATPGSPQAEEALRGMSSPDLDRLDKKIIQIIGNKEIITYICPR